MVFLYLVDIDIKCMKNIRYKFNNRYYALYEIKYFLKRRKIC